MEFEPKTDAETPPEASKIEPGGARGRFLSFSEALGGVENRVIYESGQGPRKGSPKWDSES